MRVPRQKSTSVQLTSLPYLTVVIVGLNIGAQTPTTSLVTSADRHESCISPGTWVYCIRKPRPGIATRGAEHALLLLTIRRSMRYRWLGQWNSGSRVQSRICHPSRKCIAMVSYLYITICFRNSDHTPSPDYWATCNNYSKDVKCSTTRTRVVKMGFRSF